MWRIIYISMYIYVYMYVCLCVLVQDVITWETDTCDRYKEKILCLPWIVWTKQTHKIVVVKWRTRHNIMIRHYY